MVVNKHGSFYLRSGWGTKIIQAVNSDCMIFSPSCELFAVDNIGLGRVMIRALRYWADASGLTSETKAKNGIKSVKTDFFKLVEEHDRYFQLPGSLILLHRNLALNKEHATAWYWAFNEFDKQRFTKEEFVEGLHCYLAVNGMTIRKQAIDKEFNCFKSTYISDRKFDRTTIMDDDTYPLLAPLNLIRMGSNKEFEKASLSKSQIPLQLLVYSIAMDNQQASSSHSQISIDMLLEEKNQIGRYFSLRYTTLLEMLLEAENKKLLNLNHNFGNKYIEFLDIDYHGLMDSYYTT